MLVFAALGVSNDAVVNGVDFELNLSIYVLYRQRDRCCRKYSTVLEYTVAHQETHFFIGKLRC
jgi:hypothetical protein